MADTRERRTRFKDDDRLRRYRWQIYSRPAKGEATWINRYGVIMTQSEALKSIDEWEKMKAEK
jgi:hypothetical protein